MGLLKKLCQKLKLRITLYILINLNLIMTEMKSARFFGPWSSKLIIAVLVIMMTLLVAKVSANNGFWATDDAMRGLGGKWWRAPRLSVTPVLHTWVLLYYCSFSFVHFSSLPSYCTGEVNIHDNSIRYYLCLKTKIRLILD